MSRSVSWRMDGKFFLLKMVTGNVRVHSVSFYQQVMIATFMGFTTRLQRLAAKSPSPRSSVSGRRLDMAPSSKALTVFMVLVRGCIIGSCPLAPPNLSYSPQGRRHSITQE